jgi:2-C-methyl-D-erythritol 4-phosphate cytidylyltransferase
MRVSVILPAAGAGTRFGGDKLATRVAGSPVLLRAVQRFAKREDVAEIIVAGPPEPERLERFRETFGATLAFAGARIIPGGRAERWETVLLALASLGEECTHVAIHDAARPCALKGLIDRIFAAAAKHPAVVPGVAISATVKRVGDVRSLASAEDRRIDAILGRDGDAAPTAELSGRPVLETVPRAGLVTIQTPQVFERSLIVNAYERCRAQGLLSGATDDAQVVERAGGEVLVVEGDVRNVKVTTREDLDLAAAILALEPSE